jgi:hypothetical protein
MEWVVGFLFEIVVFGKEIKDLSNNGNRTNNNLNTIFFQLSHPDAPYASTVLYKLRYQAHIRL